MSAVVILVVVAVKAVVGQKSTQGWQSVLLVEGCQPHLPLDLPLPPFAIAVEAVIAQCPAPPQGLKDHGQRPAHVVQVQGTQGIGRVDRQQFPIKG